ncbi:MAG: SDR family oxidoreductase [Gemmatimonadales bacterium]|nr:SDR family oxidoreductase [Gemmatimonadales bacterium]MDQ3209175.1 SDR family oxidoreductase [Gemmatimonadota bacterium]
MIDLSGLCALITGGSRGIGRAAALLLARSGADVAITYHTRAREADATAAEIRSLGRRAFVVGGDLADPEVAQRLASGIEREFGGLDIFVANAGIWPAEEVRLADMPVKRWRSTVQANLDSVFVSTRAVLPLLRPGGRVVIVSSTAGQRGEAFHSDYAATKGALISLTKSLAIEYASSLVVNCVAPGWVDTEMSAPAFTPENRQRIRESIPIGRIASAEDIAGPILFLCSNLARHVTGEVLNVNGGSVLCG